MPAIGDTWPESFTFRGRPDGSSSWSFQRGSIIANPDTGEPEPYIGRLMTAQEAAAAGFSLETVVTQLNAGALAQVEGLTAQVATLEAEKEELQQATEIQTSAEVSALRSQVEALSQANATLQAQIDAAGGEPAEA